jgi:16S rRNA (cytidine1402-2'-O)-methyltransferase
MPGILYLVATPIGNLGDITFRAVETLRGVDLIACEDTRHSQKLLSHLGIHAKTVSYHAHNENERSDELLRRLMDGESVAVISDAGTPGISDPGFRLIEKAIEKGISVVSVPGPVAFVNAVVASGLPTDSLFYGGFLPSKTGERRRRLEEVKSIPATLVFYESPHRLAGALSDCLAVLGNRKSAVARELTKLYEEFTRGNLSRLAAEFAENDVKGEIVIVVDRFRLDAETPAEATILPARVAELEAGGLDRKEALKRAAKEFGVSKSEAYRQVQAGKK